MFSKIHHWVLLLIPLAVSIALGGCSEIRPVQGKPVADERSNVGLLRPRSEKHGERFFFNEKSRQIEESLGL